MREISELSFIPHPGVEGNIWSFEPWALCVCKGFQFAKGFRPVPVNSPTQRLLSCDIKLSSQKSFSNHSQAEIRGQLLELSLI